MRAFVSVCLLCYLICPLQGQFLDIARVEHTNVPGHKSNFEYRETRFVFNYPFKLKKQDTYLFLGLDYSNINFRYREEIESFDKSETKDFTLLDLKVSYTAPMKNDWRFAIQVSPGLSSNFERGYELDDWVISSIVAFIKDMKDAPNVKKPYRIFIGALYSGNSGIPFPIPFIRYYRKIHPKWSYNIGAPVSNFQYHASERLRFKVFATLDGFNANLQRERILSSGETANRLRLNMIISGLRTEYKFSEHIESFLTVSRTLNASLEVRANRRGVMSFPVDNVMHYRLGVRCKI